MIRLRTPARAGQILVAAATLAATGGGTAHATDWVSAEAAGMGGAAVADPRDNSNTTVNPALLGLIERYDFAGFFVGGPSNELGWHVSAIDGRTSKRLGFGVAYNGGLLSRPFATGDLPGWITQDEELLDRSQTHDITLGIAVPVLDRKLSFGINGTVSIWDNPFKGNGVTGNLDLGFAARPIEQLTIGLVGSSILPIDGQAGDPASIGFALRGGVEDMIVGTAQLEARVEDFDDGIFRVRAGLEGTAKLVHLRAGWDWSQITDQHRVSVGLGVFTSKIGTLDYGIQIPIVLQDFDAQSMTHTVSLTLFTKLADRDNEERPIRWQDKR